MWQDPVSRVRTGMRRRFRRAVVSAAAVVVVAAAGVTFVVTRHAPQPGEPPLADGVVAWIDAPAAAQTPQAPPILDPFGLNPCQEADMAQLDVHSVVADTAPQSVGLGLRVQNIGAEACVLSARPIVQKLARDGSPVGGSVEPGVFDGLSTDGAESIALRPGHSGVAWLSFRATPACENASGEAGSMKITANGKALTLNQGLQLLSCPAKIGGWQSDLTGPFSGLRAEISGGSLKQGKEYRYIVELTNVTKAEVSLTHCPAYTQQLQPSGPDLRHDPLASSHRLNCDRPAIGPGEVVRYQMRMPVAADLPVGAWTLTWSIPGSPAGFLHTAVRPY
ncbi:hypothetical protein Rhe02_17760 [Rhizocola hellebori]|uniref:DUF4232 domain-containing protein n=2 Tax=Rhizocola hellebori TaxID=1392758 RepID=A0A8J3Q5C6_9ACTN|nr:hypothetical protein Rhe02_17760 [Rhizocola hellebori]